MFADMMYPKRCLGCGKLGMYICLACEKKLAYVETDVCFYCKKMSPHGQTHPDCQYKQGIDGVLSVFQYNPLLKKIIAAIKYELATAVWHDFKLTVRPEGLYAWFFFRRIIHNAIIIPLPLHPRRQNARGFNQAELIARWASDYLAFPVKNVLVRKRNTPFQARLTDDRARHNNVRDAFCVQGSGGVSEKNIILVDDVVTSGSTLKEAARACWNAGARSVYVLTLARG